ncbi:2-oxo acid dehydrogenase subunit E2 [Buchnera aphidicola]|uniref:2-oxo acid dehydrogenase subunit E2 n=1 Tax=Buchnera aphidicola TaxID=9 RepID=UPI003464751E
MDKKIKIPDIGIDQAEVIDILVKKNDSVKKEQTLIIIEGDKASMEIPSPFSGTVKDIIVNISDIIKTNSVIMTIDVMEDVNIKNKKNIVFDDINQDHNIYENKKHLIYASPLIRRLGRSLDIDLNKIVGTGRNKRIIKKDIDNYIINTNHNTDEKLLFNNHDYRLKNISYNRFGEIEEVKINKIKKASGDLLFKNWSTIPHVTQFDEVDITELEEFRLKYNQSVQNKKDKKLTALSFVIKAVSKGLEKFPYFNSSISEDNEKIILKKYINIGIAIDTSRGLMVPVINNINKKNLSDIAYEVFSISHKAREGKLSIADLQGGCFTISSLGGIGGTYFSPIINSSESSILGISKSYYKPYWTGKQFIPKLVLPLSLSYNHRIIDGAEGARFISYINSLLCDIRYLLI